MMKTQVEIFVNRMKSNSSRGRSISCDSAVQTLFMNVTSLHGRLLTFIKDMDDKRMWYEQLQDKLTQIKDSRAALDVLRQEHQEKLQRIAGTVIIIVFQVICIVTAIIMGARLSKYKQQLRAAGMSPGPVTAPEPIMTEKPKY